MNISKSRSKNPGKVLLTVAALSIFVFSCLKPDVGRIDVTLTAKDRNEPVFSDVSKKNYGTFSHVVPEHKEINCDSCHKRADNSLALKFPAHDSCIGCHLNEFTNSGSGICIICHEDLKAVPATMRPFPERFSEGFNMKFDHAIHLDGAGKPPAGCAACHLPQGAGQTIPAGRNAHAQCFTCHTTESPIGSCNVCHEIAPYRRTPATSNVLKAVFRHSDHSRSVTCTECHTVKAGAPQSRQVSAPVAVQHFSAGGAVSCRTCHNDARAFGQRDFANCSRCHGGSGFDMLPGS